jgi:flavin-binding protein dodecin
MKTVGKITNTWKNALDHIKNNNIEKAVKTLDTCLLILAQATEEGKTQLDNVKIDTWKVRVWVSLEELNVIPEYDAYI